jgi:hypothetical protein
LEASVAPMTPAILTQCANAAFAAYVTQRDRSMRWEAVAAAVIAKWQEFGGESECLTPSPLCSPQPNSMPPRGGGPSEHHGSHH